MDSDSDDEEDTAHSEEDVIEQVWMSQKNLLNELLSLVDALMIEKVELRIKKIDVPSQKTRRKSLHSNRVAKRRSYDRHERAAVLDSWMYIVLEKEARSHSQYLSLTSHHPEGGRSCE